MDYTVVEAMCLKDYIVHLRFEDGTEGNINLESIIGKGPMFEPHKDIDFFCEMRIDKRGGTICWPDESDLAPDTLYEKIKAAGGKLATL